LPIYLFTCDSCKCVGERFRPVEQRDEVEFCPHCEPGLMKRVFVPTANVVVPAHFRIEANWCLPDADDTAGWDARQGGSQRHAPPTEDFQQYFERTVGSVD